MKTIYSRLFFAALSCIILQSASAQVWLGVYGFRASSTNYINPDIGGGFAMSFLSKETPLSAQTTTLTAVAQKINSPLRMQFGGNFAWSGLGHTTFENVPLTSQAGLARTQISNCFLTFNVLGRISAPNKSIFTPYADAFVGYRGTFSSMEITPYVHTVGTQYSTSNNLATVSGLNYGVGGGFTTMLNKKKTVKLDLGISYMEQLGGGQYADLNRTSADNSGINLNMKHAPNGIVLVNVGLQFWIDDDGKDDCHCNCKHHRNYSSTRVGGGWGSWGGGGGARSSVGVHVGGGGGGVRFK